MPEKFSLEMFKAEGLNISLNKFSISQDVVFLGELTDPLFSL